MSLKMYISLKLIKVLFKFYSNDACNITFKYDVELLRYIF